MTTAAVRYALVMVAVCAGAFTPAAAQTVHDVPAGGDLQAAINAAQPGDTILLAAGATYVGNFVLPAKGGDAFITIRSAADDSVLPAPGERVTPAHAAWLPKLRAPNTMAVIRTDPRAHHYRLMFLELHATVPGASTILALGDGSSQQDTLDEVPFELEVDRVYIHGDPTYGAKRGIGLNSKSTRITNSYIADIKAAGMDTQAIGGWNGPGPYVVTNNYLEAAGENIMFGGSDPAIPNLVPSDITIRGNHFFKPLSWRGSAFTVKNLFELKSAQRVVVDRNLFENNWAAAQTGSAILLKSVNQDGGAPWSVVQDVEFTNNIVRNVSSAVNILGRDTRYPALVANNIIVRNNLFANVSGSAFGGVGRLLLINGGENVVFDHNTVINDGSSTVFADGNPVQGFVFTNNVLLDNGLAFKASGVGEGTATLNAYFPGSVVTGNIIANANASAYPSANFYPALSDVGFADYATGDYRLSDGSAYKLAAADATDPGVNFAALASPDGGGDNDGADTEPTSPHTPENPGEPGSPTAPDEPNAPGPPSTPSAPSVPSAPSAPGPGAPSQSVHAGSSSGVPAENTDRPFGLSVSVVESRVSISWNAPLSRTVLQYMVEAGSGPGAANIARLLTGNAAPGLIAEGVPNGAYYVRVRAVTPAGIGEPSGDASFIVGQSSGACLSVPLPPTTLVASVTGAAVQLNWGVSAGPCAPTHYVVQAGSDSGLGNLAQVATSGPSLVTNAPSGTYYVRVIAVNHAGQSAPSNEIIVRVP